VVKLRKIKWVGHIHTGEISNAYRNLTRKSGRRIHLNNLGLEGKVILICILNNWGVRIWTGFVCFRIGSIVYTIVNVVMNQIPFPNEQGIG